jgi:hypothetical protein
VWVQKNLDTHQYSNLETEETNEINQNEFNLKEIIIETTKTDTNIEQEIIQYIKKSDHLSLLKINIYTVHNYVCNIAKYEDWIEWNLKDYFILAYYREGIKLGQFMNWELNYFKHIISIFISVILFFSPEYGQNIILFLSKDIEKKSGMFNLNLYMELLLNPDYSDDDIKLNMFVDLVKSNIINLNETIKFYTIAYSPFQLILFGKMKKTFEINSTILYWDRFFNLNSVLQIIDKLSDSKCLNLQSEQKHEILSSLDEFKSHINMPGKECLNINLDYIEKIIQRINHL